jgi:hypothetical protein
MAEGQEQQQQSPEWTWRDLARRAQEERQQLLSQVRQQQERRDELVRDSRTPVHLVGTEPKNSSTRPAAPALAAAAVTVASETAAGRIEARAVGTVPSLETAAAAGGGGDGAVVLGVQGGVGSSGQVPSSGRAAVTESGTEAQVKDPKHAWEALIHLIGFKQTEAAQKKQDYFLDQVGSLG